jgi:hypothetical protein
MDFTYCYNRCKVGQAAAAKILADSDSVSDAAIDFQYFIEGCAKSCPYKESVLKVEGKPNEISVSKREE